MKTQAILIGSLEIHRRIARIVVPDEQCRFVLGPKALEAVRSLDQGSVHAEVFVRQQPLPVGRLHPLVEQGPVHTRIHAVELW